MKTLSFLPLVAFFATALSAPSQYPPKDPNVYAVGGIDFSWFYNNKAESFEARLSGAMKVPKDLRTTLGIDGPNGERIAGAFAVDLWSYMVRFAGTMEARVNITATEMLPFYDGFTESDKGVVGVIIHAPVGYETHKLCRELIFGYFKDAGRKITDARGIAEYEKRFPPGLFKPGGAYQFPPVDKSTGSRRARRQNAEESAVSRRETSEGGRRQCWDAKDLRLSLIDEWLIVGKFRQPDCIAGPDQDFDNNGILDLLQTRSD